MCGRENGELKEGGITGKERGGEEEREIEERKGERGRRVEMRGKHNECCY